jgi:hypothetical protein
MEKQQTLGPEACQRMPVEVGAAKECPSSRSVLPLLCAEKMNNCETAVAKDATLGSPHPIWSDGAQTAMINRQLLPRALLSTFKTMESAGSEVA